MLKDFDVAANTIIPILKVSLGFRTPFLDLIVGSGWEMKDSVTPQRLT
jgi:hypothetical protein